MNDRLTIISVEQKQDFSKPQRSSLQQKRHDVQIKFEQMWQDNPKQFDPERNCMERERIKRTLSLILKESSIEGKQIVDLGCGAGILARELASRKAQVDAVDISKTALQFLKEPSLTNINPLEDLIPFTKLPDDHYDFVISTELIGYLTGDERRLYISELSRLIKSDGFVVCSTSLDIHTENALQDFATLLDTEFNPIEWFFSYHAYLIKMKTFLKAPEMFAKGYKDKLFRTKELQNNRSKLSRFFYQLNSSWCIGPIWNCLKLLSNPLLHFLEQNHSLMLKLEKICHFFSSDDGISHVIFIGQRRPFNVPTQEELLAIEPKHKKQVWE